MGSQIGSRWSSAGTIGCELKMCAGDEDQPGTTRGSSQERASTSGRASEREKCQPGSGAIQEAKESECDAVKTREVFASCSRDARNAKHGYHAS